MFIRNTMQASLLLALFLLPAASLAAAEDMPRREHQVLQQAQQKLEQDEAKESIEALRQYKQNNTVRSPLFFLILGNAHYGQNRPEKAVEAYSRGLELDPEHPELLQNYAGASLESGDFLQAGRSFRKAYKAKEEEAEPQLLYRSAASFYQGEHFERALQTLEKLLGLEGERDPEWVRLLVHTCMQLEKWPRAVSFLQQLLRQQPQNAQYWKLMAQARQNQGRGLEAAGALEVAYSLEPPESSAWKDLAGLYASADAPLQAARTYRKGCGRDCSVQDWSRIAQFYAMAGRFEEAAKKLGQAAEKEQEPELYLEKGSYLYQGARFRQARESFQRALDLEPQEEEKARLHLWLGYTAWQMREWETAQRHLERAARQEDHRRSEEARSALRTVLSVLEAEEEKMSAAETDHGE